VTAALRNLSLVEEIAESIALSGGIEALIAAAGAHPQNQKVLATTLDWT
jgi:hypothetical protein